MLSRRRCDLAHPHFFFFAGAFAFDTIFTFGAFAPFAGFGGGGGALQRGLALGCFLGEPERAQAFGFDALGVARGFVFRHGGRAFAGLGFLLMERGLCAFHVLRGSSVYSRASRR